MADDTGIRRRTVLKTGAAAASVAAGIGLARYQENNEEQIQQHSVETNYIGKNTELDSVGLKFLSADFYPNQEETADGQWQAIKNQFSDSKQTIWSLVSERRTSGSLEPAPVDGGGQYQGNPQSTGFTETAKDPVTGFGEAQATASPGANLSAVSLNGRTATAGNGSLEVYDEDGNPIASFDKGTETGPLLIDGGSTVLGADATGLYKYDVASGSLSASFDDTGSQGALKILNGVIGVEADGAADFFDAEDLSRVSEVPNSGPTLRSLAFASSNNAIYTDGQGVEGVDPGTGEVNWQFDPFGNRVASAGGATNGDVYVATDSAGRAHIIDVADGSKLDTLDIGEEPSVSSPVFDTDDNFYTLTGALTKFNSSYDEVWQSSIAGLGNNSVGIDDKIMVSTTEAVQMFDKETGELVDEVLNNDQAKSLGMPRGGGLPVIEFDSGNYYEVPLQRASSGEDTDPASSFIEDLSLETYKNDPSESKPTAGETTELDVILGLGGAPNPVEIGYELVLNHEGEVSSLTDSMIVQPNETAIETYPVETETASTDAISSNGTAFSWEVNFEDDSDPGNETVVANSTLDNSTYDG